MKRMPAITLFLIFMMYIVGCSGTVQNPTNPQDVHQAVKPDTIPIALASLNDVSTGESVLGLYSGVIDLENMSSELTPLRHESAGTTDSAEVDITNFLIALPCNSCAKIMGIAIDSHNQPILRIGVKHPFAPGDPTEPATASNRLDLHVFNVRGYIISDGTETPQTFTASGKKVGGFKLVSADGYSGDFDTYWDNYFVTESNLHPYVLHFDDYSVGNFDATNENGFTDLANPTGNLVMKMGSDYDVQSYVFNINGTSTFEFMFALSASYGVSASAKNQRLSPTYRIPQFNSKAASEVRVTDVDDSQFFAGNSLASCTVTIEVMDMNHGVAVGEGLDQMSADSSVKQIAVEIPGVTDPFWATSTPELFLVSGDGRTEPLIYNLVINNDLAADIGSYKGLLMVVDAYTGSGNLPGNAIYSVPPGGDPTKAFFLVDQWATYTTFDVDVRRACGPITGSITTPPQPAITINNNQVIQFNGQGSSANGGDPIVQYKWIWGDGTNDTLGSSAQHQFINPNCGGTNQQVQYTVALKLTDSCTPPNVTQVDTVIVTVTCPTCFNYIEDFDGGTDGDWDVADWTTNNTDDSTLYYGGWDEYNNQMGGTNCTISKCASGNCFFTSGDNIAEGLPPGFCNDYSGEGHYYLTTPIIDLHNLQVSEVTMTIKHFYQVLNGATPDGCAVYASINGGLTFPTHVSVTSGEAYNQVFNTGIRNGDACFSGISTQNNVVETVFNLTPFIGQSQVVLRFEQHNNNAGAVGTMGFPVGWWIDEVLIDICP